MVSYYYYYYGSFHQAPISLLSYSDIRVSGLKHSMNRVGEGVLMTLLLCPAWVNGRIALVTITTMSMLP